MLETMTVAEVEERLRAGDPTLGPDDLLRAEAAERFAALKDKAERRAEAERDEQERLARVAEIRADLPTRLDPRKLERARQRMTAAIDEWVRVCAEHDSTWSATYYELEGLRARGPAPGVALNANGPGTMAVDGTTYRRTPLQRAIVEATTAAVRAHLPRTEVRLGNHPD